MKRNYWDSSRLTDAATLLSSAARHLDTGYPYTNINPNPITLPAVKSLIAAALESIKNAQPGDD